MLVSTILKEKGTGVVTTRPETNLAEVANMLTRERIGAVVITDERNQVVGIISERDIVNGLSEHGTSLLELEVSKFMTRDVYTCVATDNMNELRREMTSRRIRHIPVVEDGRLAGIVSIGDVVKNRVDELENETQQLREYIEKS